MSKKKKVPEGKHMMPGGMMMSDKEMKKKMKKRKMMSGKGSYTYGGMNAEFA